MSIKGISRIVIILISGLVLNACNNSEQNNLDPLENSLFAEQSDGTDLVDAPDFTLTMMNGEPFTLSEHQDKIVILNIWATWCPPCRDEIPDFIEIQNEMGDDVLFVGISTDKEGWEVVRPFADEFQINYPLVVDDGTISNKYGPIQGIPMSFVINREGKVEYVIPGMVNKETLQPVLERLVNQNN